MTAPRLQALHVHALGIRVERFKRSNPDDDAASWAHVSGWAQLSGRPRRISCVLSCHDDAAALAHLLPDISDTLTELGFPWELIVVDSASTDASGELLSEWTELPGFNWMRLAIDYGDIAAAWAGLCHAQGDAVVLIDAATVPPLARLSELVDRWNEGDEVVTLDTDRGDGSASVIGWPLCLGGSEPLVTAFPNLIDGANRLLLLDRRAVDSLIASRLHSTSSMLR